ncbi:hypothetical protein, partial [Frankia sp. Cr1]|uniref:hypothetical protein n=1 Tax=Frankia sp. Cr1 TaxID=3073931 RepID=UPI002AD504D1
QRPRSGPAWPGRNALARLRLLPHDAARAGQGYERDVVHVADPPGCAGYGSAETARVTSRAG